MLIRAQTCAVNRLWLAVTFGQVRHNFCLQLHPVIGFVGANAIEG